MPNRDEWTTWQGARPVVRAAATLGDRVVIHETLDGAGAAPAVCRHTPPAFITESPGPRIVPLHISMPADPNLQPVVGVLADCDGRTARSLGLVEPCPRYPAVMLSLRPHTHDLRNLPKVAGTTILSDTCSYPRRRGSKHASHTPASTETPAMTAPNLATLLALSTTTDGKK